MSARRPNVMAWAVAAALGSTAGGAAASGFQLMEQNASGLGNAYAGQAASAQDASTIFFNAAGLTKLPGRSAVGALNVIRPRAEFTNLGSGPIPVQPTLGGNGGDGGDFAYVPNFYLSWQATPQIFLGLAVNTPFGLKTDYDAGWVGRFYALKSDLKTININPTIAYKVNDRLSIGGGVNYQYAKATLSNSVNYSAAAAASGVPGLFGAIGGPGVEGVGTVKGDDGAWGWNIGGLFDVGPNTRIGASYRSAVDFHITGDATFTNRPALLGGAIPDGPASADIKLPATASFAVFHQISPKWDVMADATWTEWKNLQTLDIFRSNTGARLSTTPLNWESTWRVGVGANYHHSPEWTLRFGAAYDQTPTQDSERTPRVPDQDRTWLAFGAQYRWSKQLAIDVGYAHLFVKDATVNLCGPAAAAANPAACGGKNNLVGSFSGLKVDIFSIQARYSF